ncbi:hypothetical protein ABIE49_001155 [Bradyrhizobium sp. OAE829]
MHMLKVFGEAERSFPPGLRMPTALGSMAF